MVLAKDVVVGHFPVYIQNVISVCDPINLLLCERVFIGINRYLFAGLDDAITSRPASGKGTISGFKGLILPQGMQHYKTLKIEGWGMPTIYCMQTEEKVGPWFQIRGLDTDDSDPGSLIQMKVIYGCLERSHISQLLSLVAANSFIQRSAGHIDSFLRDTRLPYSNSDSAESGQNQSARKQCQPRIGFDLRSRELMLLIFAAAAGCLLFVLRGIKNNSFPLAMVGYVSVFLIGQFAVYLLCKRMYGLSNTNTAKGRIVART